jgi:hypothetical protein
MIMLCACIALVASCEQRDTSTVRNAIRGQWRTTNTVFVTKLPGRFEGQDWVVPPPRRTPQPEFYGTLYFFGETLYYVVEPDGRTLERSWKALSFNDRTRELELSVGPRRDDVYRIVLSQDATSATLYWDDPNSNTNGVGIEWELKFVDSSQRPPVK